MDDTKESVAEVIKEREEVIPNPSPVPTPAPVPLPTSGIKNNKGKFIVLVLYILAVFAGSISYFTPHFEQFYNQVMSMSAPKEVDTVMRDYIMTLKNGDFNKAVNMTEQEVRSNAATSSLFALQQDLASTSDQLEIIGASFKSNTYYPWVGEDSGKSVTSSNYNVIYQTKNNDPIHRYLVISVQARDKGNGPEIMGIQNSLRDESVQEEGKFNFQTQGLSLLLSIVIPLFVAYTSYRYLTKARNPKWILFLIITFGSLYYSASNGNYSVNFGFENFVAKASPWGPMVFFNPLPIGAVYYYFVRKRHEKEMEKSDPVPS